MGSDLQAFCRHARPEIAWLKIDGDEGDRLFYLECRREQRGRSGAPGGATCQRLQQLSRNRLYSIAGPSDVACFHPAVSPGNHE